ncbi:hypothetical protein [Streptacidiphilus rugosus]|uniref:hypothetical protein n=1 Tax=Streptacidiphilus rugosus TaxID=405783 RepID=UPI000A660F2C|nr:hypothetical protein [Streptacidiphilus rugosus]
MDLNQHRTTADRPGPARRVLRAGLLAAAGLGVLGTTTVAQAVHGVAVDTDAAHTLANPGHRQAFADSFSVHQEGLVYAASARNQATAVSGGCSADDPCRSIALSFQIVTMAGTDIHLNALNLGRAVNHHCDACETLAGAYQFIVSTPRPFTLGAAAQRRLADIHRRLDALRGSTAPVSEIQHQADALAAEVTALLEAAAATAPKGPGISALAAMEPKVTVHRMFDRS